MIPSSISISSILSTTWSAIFHSLSLPSADFSAHRQIPDWNCRFLKSHFTKFLFLSSFFYKKLLLGATVSELSKWTRGKHFEADHVFIPINENFHWSLVILTNPRKEIECICKKGAEASSISPDRVRAILYYLDSLGQNGKKALQTVEKFIQSQWSNSKFSHISLRVEFKRPCVPTQVEFPCLFYRRMEWPTLLLQGKLLRLRSVRAALRGAVLPPILSPVEQKFSRSPSSDIRYQLVSEWVWWFTLLI